MVILSSDEFRNLESNRLNLGITSLTDDINRTSTVAFGHSNSTNPSHIVESVLNKNGYIGYILMNDRVVASGFGHIDTTNTKNKYKTMNLNTISVNSEYRGQGLCQKITSEFVKKFGKYILYLTVRTESGNENVSGIKCYEKQGFVLLPEVYRDHYDGKNTAMVRVPNQKNTIRKKRRSNRRNRSNRRSNLRK